LSLYDDIQEKLENVRVYDGYFFASCLWHGTDNHPSMQVKENGWFECKTCHKHGSIKYLASQVNRSNFGGKIKSNDRPFLPQWSRWYSQFGEIDEVATVAHKKLLKYPETGFYFKKRKVDQFIKQGMFGTLDGWNLFPILDRNRTVIDIIVRSGKPNSENKYVLRPDDNRENPNLYVPNWKRVDDSDDLYIVYGIMDAWALEAIGLPVVTGSAGKSIHPDSFKEFKYKYIHIIPDRYEERDAYNLALSLGSQTDVIRMNWPDEDYKDCDDIRRKLGEDTLRKLI
jgi:hypothetical protein